MKSYFKYAIGEILLVVIGILIALYIKGWYADNEIDKQIDKTALQIVEDLKMDTTIINGIVKYYDERKSLYQQILGDSLSVEDVRTCQKCFSLVSIINTFEPNIIGYSILKEFDSDLISKKDSLIHDTKFFYSRFIPFLELIDQMIKDDIAANLKDWKDNKIWYSGMISGRLGDDYFEYIAHDPYYKNKVANFSLLLYQNYMPVLKVYSEGAVKLKSRWEEMLKEE